MTRFAILSCMAVLLTLAAPAAPVAAQTTGALPQAELAEMMVAAEQSLGQIEALIPTLDERLDQLYDLRDATDEPTRQRALDGAIDRLNLTVTATEEMRNTIRANLTSLKVLAQTAAAPADLAEDTAGVSKE